MDRNDAFIKSKLKRGLAGQLPPSGGRERLLRAAGPINLLARYRYLLPFSSHQFEGPYLPTGQTYKPFSWNRLFAFQTGEVTQRMLFEL